MIREDYIFFFIRYLSKVLKANSYIVQYGMTSKILVYTYFMKQHNFFRGFDLTFLDKIVERNFPVSVFFSTSVAFGFVFSLSEHRICSILISIMLSNL